MNEMAMMITKAERNTSDKTIRDFEAGGIKISTVEGWWDDRE